jgi:iron complex outermembrane receptor protein
MRVVLAALAGALLPGAALAQTPDNEPEIVITAPLEGSLIESLQGATALDRDDIVATLNGGLGDTLDAQPGVSTTFFGAGASRPIIRGLGEDRVRVLQNGIGAIDASTASPDHAVTADGLDADRIEVLRGAAALAYGGNAIGGVVNVIDQSIPTRAELGLSGTALGSYSSVDQGTQAAVSALAGGGPLAFRVTGAARDTGDYDTPVGEAENSWTELRTYSIGGASLGDWGYAGAALKHTADNYGLPPEAPGEPGGHIEMEQTRYETRGDIKVHLGAFNRIDFGAQTSDYEHTEFEGDGAAGTRFTSEGWEARLEGHHRGERLRGAVGLQITDVDFAAEGEEAFITPTNTRDTGVFVVERYDTGNWGLEGGARVERREIDNVGGGAREFENLSLSLGAFFRPSENWFVGATIANTERAPTAIELFAEGPHLATANYERGNTTLEQETARSFEVSARYDANALSFELNLFRIDFEDYVALLGTDLVWYSDPGTLPDEGIVLDTDPILASLTADAEVLPVFQFTPRDASFTGGEITVRSHLFDAGSFAIRGDASIDLVQAEFDGGGRPPRIPPRSLTLGLEAENPYWTGRLELVDTAEQNRVAQFETSTEGYTFINAGLAFRPSGDNGALTLRLDARNLSDEEGRVHASFLKNELPLPGRNFRLTLTTEF